MTAPADGPLRVGIVGCGYATTDRHLPALARIDEAEAVALADVDEKALQAVGDRWEISRRYGSVLDLVADSLVDVVAICVPPTLHLETALAALDHGKHVLIEKPLTVSAAEADELVRRADACSQQVAVGFNLRSHALIEDARALIQAGAVGAVQTIRTTFTDPLLNRPSLPPWRRSRASGGGALLDKAVHHFDLWRFLLNDEVEEVQAFTRGDDETVVVSARLSRGVLASAVVSDTTPVHNDVTISGDAGELEISLYRFDGLTLSPSSEIPGAAAARIRKARGSLSQLVRARASIRRGGYFALSYDEQWRRLVRAIREGKRPSASVRDGRQALLIALAAARAAEEGRTVSLKAITVASSNELEAVTS